MGRKQVIAWLEDNVSHHRLKHILGVETYAARLAKEHQVDSQKAAQAGLMHDLAKFFPAQKLLAMAKAENLVLDEILEQHPHLIHADVSAIVARDRFGVSDREILDAIRNHTLGRPGMDKLSCILYIADAVEPNRGDSPELEAIRQVAPVDLYRGLLMACDCSLQYLVRQQKAVHPRTVLTRHWASQQVESQRSPSSPSISA